MCQTVNLSVGLIYTFGMDFAKPFPVKTANANVYLNRKFMKSSTNSYYSRSAHIGFNFNATVTKYEICINGSTVWNLDTSLYFDLFTPLIDNVSII